MRRTSRLARSSSLHVSPRTANQLHAWLRLAVDIDVPRTPLLAGSAAPFDYLIHSFFEDSRVRDCVVWANRGGGKTFLGAVSTMLDLVFKPGIEVRILGGSLEQSQRMQRHLRMLFEKPLLRDLVDGRITERRLRLVNGSLCETLAQSHTSVRGCRVQKLRCDEVELFDPDVWEAAQLVTRSKQCGEVFVRGAVEAFSTMHRAHGLMARVVSEAGESRRVFRWGVIDALEECEAARPCEPCALFEECGGKAKAARGFIAIEDAIALKRRSSADAWRSEMLCEMPSRSDLVLPEFERDVHVVGGYRGADGRDARPTEFFVCGMDFGFRAPTVVLWGAVDGDGVLRILDERVERGVVLDAHVRAIVDSPWPAARWVGIDPAGRQRSEQTGISAATAMRRAGLVVRDRRLSVMEGIELIRARLAPATGGPRLFVHERCEKLIESLESYHFPSERPQAIEPVKDGSDHAVDALRYLVVNLDKPHRMERWRYA